jgi:YMGG-like Gly-zipper
MRMKALAFTLAVIIVLVQSPVVVAQANVTPREWSNVVAIAADERLEVKLKSGKTLKGKLSSVTDSGLTLSHGKKELALKRDEIFRIYRAGGKSSVSPTVIGAGVGAGVGTAAGAVILGVNEGEDDEIVPTLILTALVGAGIGALTGFLSGKSRSNRVLIYESR